MSTLSMFTAITRERSGLARTRLFVGLFALLGSQFGVQGQTFCTGDPIPASQLDLRNNPEYEPGKCPANDVQILGARIETGDACNSCEPGTVVVGDLIITVHHNTNSGGRHLGVFGKLTETPPGGSPIECDVARCSGPLLKSSEETDPHPVTGTSQDLFYGQITFTCGSSLQLSDILLVWTAANGACPVTPDNNPNGKYCFDNPIIDIVPPLNAVIQAECGVGNTGNFDLTVTGGSGDFSYDWDIDGTGDFDDPEDLVNVPLRTYTVVVKDNVNVDEFDAPCTVTQTETFDGPCCEFFATCALVPTEQVIEGCDVGALPDPFTDPADVFTDITDIPCGDLTLIHNDDPDGTLCPDGLTVVRTYTLFDDLNGNGELDNGEEFETCVENFRIVDTKAPVITCPDDANVECDDIPAVGTPTATDNCDGDVDIVYDGETRIDGDCPDSYTLKRTWTATDNCGNSSSCTQTITVEDTKAPVITCPDDANVECDDIPAVGTPTATDNCDGDVDIVYDGETRIDGDCPDSYTLKRTWTATDNCGNSSSCTQTITVEDTKAPVITCPDDANVECDDIPAVGTPTATDNCDGDVDIVYDGETRIDGDCPDSYTLKRTWTATDNCGNSSSCTQTITVEDTKAPVITCPDDANVECDDIPAVGTPTATDNCDGDVDIVYDGETRIDGDCPDSYTLKRTWTATDNCGNSSSCTQTITVEDTKAPVITCPDDANVECDDIPAVGTPTATDNCDGDVDIVYDGETRIDGDCPDSYTLKRTWTATDNCGNSSSCTQTITVEDTKAPVITCPDDANVECDDIPAVGTPTATDNCDGDVDIVYDGETRIDGDCPDSYTLKRTWTATDNCGNSSSCTQTITVEDTKAPVITCPDDANVECDDIPAVGTPTATDNCDGDVDIVYDGETRIDGDCPDSYTLKRTWTATDNCGNSSSCTQTITVEDTKAPVITCPDDANVECDDIPAVGTPTATDNCDGDVDIVYDGETRIDGDCPDSYTLKRTWTATDNCGNSSSCTQTITVEDTKAPVITCPDDANVECDDIPAVGTPTATDNCDGDVDIVYDGETRIDGDCPDSYTLKRTWTATDNCGNSSSCTQTITVEDTKAPVITCPDDANVECDDIPAVGTPTATDNCDGDVDIVYDGETRIDGDCPDSYTLKRTWTATDNCGNSSSCTQTITVEDTKAPVITCPDDANVECDDIPAVGTPTATDNCDGDVDIVYDGETRIDGDCPDSYTLKRTWTATDNCGNSSSCTQTITVEDTKAPVITCPDDANVECDDIPAVGTPTATDNCDGDVDIVYDGETRIDGDCPDSYTLKRTWTATDNCGNSSSCTQTITVEDTKAPVITCPDDANVECDDIPAVGTPTATDNCDGDVDIVYDGETRIDGDCPDSYTLKRTWTATDNCGNSSSCTQTITVEDTKAPVITCPDDANVECDDIPAVGTPTATDNCDGDVDIVYDGETRIDGDCPDSYTLKRTWTATDNCGNSSSCTQTITVEDTKAPVITCPDDANVECDDIPAVGTPTATDNCDGDVDIVYDGETRIDGDCPDSYTLKRTWTATDNCGNSSSCTQTITVEDTKAPVITCPDDANVECDDIPAVGTPTATDNCDGDVDIVYDGETRIDGDCPDSYTLKRTWTATDNCGNSSSCTQTITVEDTKAPVITCPDDANVECDDIPAVGTPTATDNCDGDVDIVYDGETRIDGDCPDSYTLKRTWTATDNCGNSSSCTQTITVEDTKAPVITCPDDANVECDDIPAVGTPTATDNCDGDVDIVYDGETRIDGDCPDSYTLKRTWTATDNCGNSSSCTQTITVEDTKAPVITCPDDANVECDDIPAVGTPTATDNCDGDVDIVYDGETRIDGDCPDSYTLKRTWTATDNCGNSSSCTQTITVDDTTPPTINCPDDVTNVVPCDEECPTNSTFTGTATAVDNCDENVDITASDMVVGDCPRTITRTWTATDDCLNSVSCVQTIRCLPPTGFITPTGTDCEDILNDTFLDQDELEYTLKNGLINRVTPGAGFYWVKEITAPSSDFTIAVEQENDLGWKPMECDENNIKIWDADCNQLNNAVTLIELDVDGMGTAEITVSGLTEGDTYFLSKKLFFSKLKGQLVADPEDVNEYCFTTLVPADDPDPDTELTSRDCVIVKPKQ